MNNLEHNEDLRRASIDATEGVSMPIAGALSGTPAAVVGGVAATVGSAAAGYAIASHMSD